LPTGSRTNPYPSFRFDVEFSDSKLVIGNFSEVSGLEANTEFEEYNEGGVNHFAHKLPTITKYPNLVLKKGMTDSNTLFEWHGEVISGNITNSRDISIILMDRQGNEVKRWTFQNAFPIKWSAADLNSTGDSIEIETIEIAHQGLVGTY
jgi:phage tail-like protein